MSMFGIDDLPVKPRMRGWIHVYAFGVSVVVGVVLTVLAFSAVSVSAGAACAVYAVTVCGVFGVSATYHRIHWATAAGRLWMKRADHSMIFVFIAGCYTPLVVLALPPDTGRTLLIVVWVGALGGVALKMLWPQAPSWVGVPLYMILGSAMVPVAPTMIGHVGYEPFLLLLVGGALYSGGAILYATKWPNPWPTTFGHHEFFHAATVLGAVCHLSAVCLILF